MSTPPPPHTNASAQVTAARKTLAKVSETIPVLYCPGNHDLGDARGGKDDESAYVQRYVWMLSVLVPCLSVLVQRWRTTVLVRESACYPADC